MGLSSQQILGRLGAGEAIADICQAAGWSRADFDLWWRRETAARVPVMTGRRTAPLRAGVTITRDRCGVPHISAQNDADLYFGYGYAVAQDRLFQLDYLRRKGWGTLAEILGPEAIESDLTSRTVGLHRVAEHEWTTLPDEVRALLQAFAEGVNALIAESKSALPIEFDLLQYAPAPWRPQDCLVIAGEFRWYLTGRFPVICIPELAKRVLGTGPLYEAFLKPEADGECILSPGMYPKERSGIEPLGLGMGVHRHLEIGSPSAANGGRSGAARKSERGRFSRSDISDRAAGDLSMRMMQPLLPQWPGPGAGETVGDPQAAEGSNNWVVSGALTTSGLPMVASDPHIAFAAVSCWHEVRLQGGSFDVTGVSYTGMPAVMIGRNPRVAWGITNNICSLRDLYQEQTSPDHPGCFLRDGQWEPWTEVVEEIRVKGADTLHKTIRYSHNGPIVDEILPAPARTTGPVALRWVGMYECGWTTALLNMGRAKSVSELRGATRPWLCPTFSIVAADVDGHIAYQATGRIPVRNLWERGYRPGWDAAHQWAGFIPFEGMPTVTDPKQGYVVTANNRVATNDFPYPLGGTWVSGHRARRVREMLEARLNVPGRKLSRGDFVDMQQDALSLRAMENVPRLLGTLSQFLEAGHGCLGGHRGRVREAAQYLAHWDFRIEPDRVAATVFDVFFMNWCKTVALQHFTPEQAAFVSGAIGGVSGELLASNSANWFTSDEVRARSVVDTFLSTLQDLERQLGPDMLTWRWGRMHTIQQKHFLSGRGELATLLDRGGVPVKGDGVTVCNSGTDPNWGAAIGAGFRMIADLADPAHGLHAVEAGSTSGHPGSPYYDDQLQTWLTAGYHHTPLSQPAPALTRLEFVPPLAP